MAARAMSAKYPGTCAGCGQQFSAGTPINYDLSTKRVSHQAHPSGAPASARRQVSAGRTSSIRNPSPRFQENAARAARMTDPGPGEQRVTRESVDRYDGYDIGMVVRMPNVKGGGGPDGHWFVPTAAGKYKNDLEDGEWRCWANVRPATDQEVAPLVAERAARARRDGALRELDQLVRRVENHVSTAMPSAKGPELVLHQNSAGSARYQLVEGELPEAWLLTSDYDTGPDAWRSRDPRAVELLQQLLAAKGGA